MKDRRRACSIIEKEQEKGPSMPKLIQFTNKLIDYGVERFMPEKVYDIRSSTLDSRFMTTHGRFCIIADANGFIIHIGIELGKAAAFFAEKHLGWNVDRYTDPSLVKPEQKEEDEGEKKDELKEGEDGKEKTEPAPEGAEEGSLLSGEEGTREPKPEGTEDTPEGGREDGEEGDGGGEEVRVEEAGGSPGSTDPQVEDTSPHVGAGEVLIKPNEDGDMIKDGKVVGDVEIDGQPAKVVHEDVETVVTKVVTPPEKEKPKAKPKKKKKKKK